jgi:hypothetical protein
LDTLRRSLVCATFHFSIFRPFPCKYFSHLYSHPHSKLKYFFHQITNLNWIRIPMDFHFFLIFFISISIFLWPISNIFSISHHHNIFIIFILRPFSSLSHSNSTIDFELFMVMVTIANICVLKQSIHYMIVGLIIQLVH